MIKFEPPDRIVEIFLKQDQILPHPGHLCLAWVPIDYLSARRWYKDSETPVFYVNGWPVRLKSQVGPEDKLREAVPCVFQLMNPEPIYCHV